MPPILYPQKYSATVKELKNRIYPVDPTLEFYDARSGLGEQSTPATETGYGPGRPGQGVHRKGVGVYGMVAVVPVIYSVDDLHLPAVEHDAGRLRDVP